MTLNTVKPRSAITRLSSSMVCATDWLLGLVMTPPEDCVLSTIRLPFEVRRSRWMAGGRHAVLLLRRSRPPAGQGFHGLLDTGNVPLDILHIQPPSDNLIVSDLEQRHPAHLEGLPVVAGARPAPFSPGRVTVLDRPADFRVEIGDPREHGLPVD